MITNDLNAKLTAAKLNENMYKKFGTKINFDKYTREELENYRNLLRTNIHQVETSSNFNDLLANETYQKDKYMMGVLNTKIKEMLGEARILSEKSKTQKQARTMAAAAHDPKFAKKVGIKQSVAKEFNKADTGTKKLSQAMKNKKTTEALKGNQYKIDANKNGKIDGDDFKKLRAKKTEGAMDTVKAVGKKVAGAVNKAIGHGSDEEMRKDLQKKVGVAQTGKKPAAPVKEASKKKNDGNLANNAKPYDKVTRGDVISGRLGKDEMGGKRKTTMKKKATESQLIFRNHVKIVNESLAYLLNEDEEGKAKAITAASDMVNDFTTWMQRVGQYQTKSMIELADSIRAEFGQAEAEAFKNAVAPALQATLETMTQQREAISHAVAVLAGEASDMDQMGGMGGGEVPDMTGGADEFSSPSGQDSMNAGDEFGASDAAAGGMETSGRELRESHKRAAAKSRIAESHAIMSILSGK
jgi:hypothetical protein